MNTIQIFFASNVYKIFYYDSYNAYINKKWLVCAPLQKSSFDIIITIMLRFSVLKVLAWKQTVK